MFHLSTLYRIDQGFENWDVNTYRFWRFCMRFSILIEFFCGFAVVDNFFDGLEVPNRPSHPSVQWSSTRVLVLQIENLSFSLLKLYVDFFFIIFNLLLLFFWKWRAVVFLTSHLNLVSVLGSLFLHLPALSSISFVIFHSSVNFQCSVTPVFCYCYYFVTASSSCKWNTEVTFIRQWWQNHLHVVIIWFSTLLLN